MNTSIYSSNSQGIKVKSIAAASWYSPEDGRVLLRLWCDTMDQPEKKFGKIISNQFGEKLEGVKCDG